MTADSAFAAYEAVRHRLPPVRKGGECLAVSTLDDLADRFDVFLLDAFGVLNIGEAAISGVPERVAGLQARGKIVMVLTNAASTPKAELVEKFHKLGYQFSPDRIVSSREALLRAIGKEPPVTWGLMLPETNDTSDLDGVRFRRLRHDQSDYDAVDAFLFLGSYGWDPTQQALLTESLEKCPRRVWVGNPDIVAPRENGFSVEPGHFAHSLAEATGIEPTFFGKPFGNVYDLAFEGLPPDTDRSRVVMVGDSLHTDILGAQTAGIASALVAGHGFFSGQSVQDAITMSGIAPDFILDRP